MSRHFSELKHRRGNFGDIHTNILSVKSNLSKMTQKQRMVALIDNHPLILS